jgi:trimeric autotransporter adhesin
MSKIAYVSEFSMNKIFSQIWNASLGQLVVASELAHCKGGQSASGGASPRYSKARLAWAIAACLGGFVGPAAAQTYNTGSGTTGTSSASGLCLQSTSQDEAAGLIPTGDTSGAETCTALVGASTPTGGAISGVYAVLGGGQDALQIDSTNNVIYMTVGTGSGSNFN